MKFNLQLKIAIGSVLMIIALAILSYQYYLTLEQLLDSHFRTESSLRISKNLEAMHLLLKDTETAQRDYVITGNDHYLSSYNQYQFQLENQIKTFEKTIHADSVEAEQAELFDNIKPILFNRIAEQKKIIDLKRNNEAHSLLNNIDSYIRRESLNHISDKIKFMESQEEKHLQKLTTKEADYSKNLIKLVPILAVILAILLLGGAVILILDVNDRQRLQNNLYRMNEELTSTVEALDVSNKELVSLNAGLESFSSTVSHDLRSPANQQSVLVDLFLMKDGNSVSDEGKLYLEKIKISANKMKLLISDLLNFSRLGKAELVKSEINFNEMVNEIIQRQQSLYKIMYKINIITLPIVKGDKGLLNQVWENLISNAFKYSSKVDSPEITINYESQKNEYVFWIEDNGDGFDMSKAQQMFKVFERMHRSDEFEGTGVGLSIVKKIIAKHGGKIWAIAEPKKGAVFSFTLPK